MGVEYYLVCKQCKEYIDLHKAYEFSRTITRQRPEPGKPNDDYTRGGYWESRGVWFLWKHRSHSDVEMHTDVQDDWYDLEPYLKEVYPHSEDIKLRTTTGGAR